MQESVLNSEKNELAEQLATAEASVAVADACGDTYSADRQRQRIRFFESSISQAEVRLTQLKEEASTAELSAAEAEGEALTLDEGIANLEVGSEPAISGGSSPKTQLFS